MSIRQWLWLALLSSFWGSAFIFMELALPTFSPALIVMGRMAIAATVLNVALLSQRWHHRHLSKPQKTKPQKKPQKPVPASPKLWLQCAGLSLFNNLLPFGLVVWGQQHINASLASILIAAAPLFTVAIASLFTREQLTPACGLGVVLGFAGVVVLIGPNVLKGFNLQGAGELAILGAALSYAVAGFVGWRFKAIPAPQLSTLTVTAGAVIMLPITLALEWPLSIEWRWSAAFAVLMLGVFSTALAYLIYYRLLADAGVVNTSLVSFLVPLSALLLSTLFLHERLNAPAVLGMTLILAGLAVLDGRLLKHLQIGLSRS
jgi:drug/metabolite transporter (DMT)-like permease